MLCMMFMSKPVSSFYTICVRHGGPDFILQSNLRGFLKKMRESRNFEITEFDITRFTCILLHLIMNCMLWKESFSNDGQQCHQVNITVTSHLNPLNIDIDLEKWSWKSRYTSNVAGFNRLMVSYPSPSWISIGNTDINKR